jgi:hypothetical protein
MSYLSELDRELASAGVDRRRRRRILAEADDHLRCDGEAMTRFGWARQLANMFAAELGTSASREAAVATFLALAVAGGVFAVSFIGLTFAGGSAAEPPLAAFASLLAITAPQVALVSGGLAFLRVLRRRKESVLSSAERVIVNRRTSVALVAGMSTMAALAVLAVVYSGSLARWWVIFTLTATAVSSSLLILAAFPILRAIRLRPDIPGPAGDVFDDIGFARFRAEPWGFALRVAAIVGLVVWIAGIAGSDPIDGLLRGVFEALACLAGFGLLGRYLGLRA